MEPNPVVAMLGTLSGQLVAYEILCQALIATHPDRPALYDQFLKRAKFADAKIPADSQEEVRSAFDAAYAQILKALRPVE